MKTKIIGLILLLAISSGVESLGFRGITVHSSLNEPLDARIALVSIAPAEADGLRISLANPQAFEKAGLIRPQQLTKLRFQTLVGDDQQLYIHITTQDGVREPFLNFLLDIALGGDKFLREYTILLDPPASAVQAAVTDSKPRKMEQQANKIAPSLASLRNSARTKQYGPVKRTETLWVIAQQVRADRSISVEQMMMALLRENPDAFRHGNVNYLKQGAVLDIPSTETIMELKAAEARRAFLQQVRDWKELKRGPSATVQQELTDQIKSAEQSAEETQPEKRLSEDGTAGAGAKLRVVETGKEETVGIEEKLVDEEAVASTEEKLSDEIADSKRDLEAVQEINRDLVELKDALELKIEALRKSVLERNSIIDNLEQRLNEVRAESGIAAVEESGSGSIVGETQKVTGGVASEIEMGRTQVEKKPLVEPIVTKPQSTDWLALADKYWLQLLVAALLLMVLLLLFLLIRRRRAESGLIAPEAFGSYIDVDGQPVTEERSLVSQNAGSQQTDALANDRLKGDFSPIGNMDVASALTEADIYLAYRRYGPAEELILESIGNNPENMILKAKLLEIYAFRKDKAKFISAMEEAYQPMIARSPEIWAKVLDMGRDVAPDHELIAGAALSDEDAMASDLSFGLDDLTESDSAEHNAQRRGEERS